MNIIRNIQQIKIQNLEKLVGTYEKLYQRCITAHEERLYRNKIQMYSHELKKLKDKYKEVGE